MHAAVLSMKTLGDQAIVVAAPTHHNSTDNQTEIATTCCGNPHEAAEFGGVWDTSWFGSGFHTFWQFI